MFFGMGMLLWRRWFPFIHVDSYVYWYKLVLFDILTEHDRVYVLVCVLVCVYVCVCACACVCVSVWLTKMSHVKKKENLGPFSWQFVKINLKLFHLKIMLWWYSFTHRISINCTFLFIFFIFSTFFIKNIRDVIINLSRFSSSFVTMYLFEFTFALCLCVAGISWCVDILFVQWKCNKTDAISLLLWPCCVVRYVLVCVIMQFA